MARKGRDPKEHVLNCLDLPSFMEHLEARARVRRWPARGSRSPALRRARLTLRAEAKPMQCPIACRAAREV
jgi:hypothetical protein